MDKLNVKQTVKLFYYIADKIIENKPYLTEVDSKIGDGDHGIGMEVGFKKVKSELENNEMITINDVFRTSGMAMLNSMGGASGVIFGTMFSDGVKKCNPIYELDLKTFTEIFERSLVSIKNRGKASVGDKTMIDAYQPAVETLRKSLSESKTLLDAFKLAEDSAKIGLENTKKYIAKFGRAKSLMERAIGYQDAGATSIWIIFRSIKEWIEIN